VTVVGVGESVGVGICVTDGDGDGDGEGVVGTGGAIIAGLVRFKTFH